MVFPLIPYAPEMQTTKFANSVDPDEAAHPEPPHLDLHCLLAYESNMI